jgi:uncharacterized protein YjbJ (UPF0337 family)
MDKDKFASTWNELKGEAKNQWAKLTEEDVSQVSGRYEELSGRIQKTYGWSKDQADREINNWCSSCKPKRGSRQEKGSEVNSAPNNKNNISENTMRDENMDRGNNAWNKDSSKGNQNNQNRNANKQNSGNNTNKGSSSGRNEFSSKSGEGRSDLNREFNRNEERTDSSRNESRDNSHNRSEGQSDRSQGQGRQDQRNGQKNSNQNTGRNNKDNNRNIDNDRRKAG